jgi:hypothetical protein
MGHINVDSIKESPLPPRPTGPIASDPGSTSSPVEIDPPEPAPSQSDSRTEPGPPAPSTRVTCSPNPFNPITTVGFTAKPDALYEVVVFSIAGRRIRSARVRTASDGTGSMIWNGRSDSGLEVASGIYAAAVIEGGRIIGVAKLVLLR